MEALALGYGSDSSYESVGSLEDNKKKVKEASTLQLMTCNYDSDHDSDNNNDEDDGEKQKGLGLINNAEKSIKADIGINNRINSGVSKICKQEQEDKQGAKEEPSAKRRRLQNRNEGNCQSAKMRALFPNPKLLQNENDQNQHNAFDSLILFPKDYVSDHVIEKLRLDNQMEAGNDDDALATKLNDMYTKFYPASSDESSKLKTSKGNITTTSSSSSSFAKHLKEQKEFGNPHLFPSIISHFGINPMGTNVIEANKNEQFAKFEYVENIVQKEEENRIRLASNSTS